MITSLIEMLELPNLGHMTTSTIRCLSHMINSVGDVMDRNYDLITFQSILTLRRPRVANFADIIKIVTIFIKTAFKD